jgi:tripartite-type tricarboxylate transporter receptor subunit TctC
MTRLILARRALFATTLVAPSLASAQARRPLRIVIPFPPGGAVDSLGRILADRLAPVLDQQVVVDNRSGGGGLIGADAVAKAPPDGTTLGVIGAATLCAAPFLQASMPFDVARDFRFISQITDSAVLLGVNAQVAAARGWTDMAALLAWARQNPGRFSVAHAGAATVSHLMLSALTTAARVEFNMIPYRGGAQAATDLVAGTIEGSADLPTSLVPQAEAGRVALLGTSSGRRLAMLPAVPAFAETPGLEGIDIRSWNMILVPAATPEAEAARLFSAIRQVGTAATFREALRPLGYDAVTSESLAAAAALVRDETPRWRQLVEASGARVQ